VSFIRIDVKKAQELIESGAVVVDIRDAHSFSAGTIDGAIRLDGSNVDDFIAQADPEMTVIVCCYHGNASQSAAAYFSENGFEQSYSLDGGYEAWQAMQG
jgi:thiosulfate sulfurtransferase